MSKIIYKNRNATAKYVNLIRTSTVLLYTCIYHLGLYMHPSHSHKEESITISRAVLSNDVTILPTFN